MNKAARGAIILGAAVLIGLAILLGMPLAAEALLGAIGGADGPSPAVAESVYLLAIFVPMTIVGIVAARLSGFAALKVGQRGGTQLAIGLGIGLGGVALAVAHAQLAGLVGWGEGLTIGAGWFVIGTLIVLVQVAAEEIFFRGWLQPALVEGFGAPVGIGVTALIFAAMHLVGGAMHPVSFLNLFLGGLLFGLLAWHSGGLAAALGVHFAWNWSEAMLFGLSPNPGVTSFGSLLDLELAGTITWGGGAEGLNASLGMTAVLLALLALLTASARRVPDRPVPAAA